VAGRSFVSDGSGFAIGNARVKHRTNADELSVSNSSVVRPMLGRYLWIFVAPLDAPCMVAHEVFLAAVHQH
jgi:hypothetical protein